MSDYSKKLEALAEKKQKLLLEETKLIEKRKHEISQSAEKLGLLTASDELITGLFLQAAKAISEKSDQIKEWETEGSRFLKSKKLLAQAS